MPERLIIAQGNPGLKIAHALDPREVVVLGKTAGTRLTYEVQQEMLLALHRVQGIEVTGPTPGVVSKEPIRHFSHWPFSSRR
jgi:hypothetical protein